MSQFASRAMKAHDAKSGSERARGNPRCSIAARFGASVQKQLNPLLSE